MRISNRKNPDNSNEFWCFHCLEYHPKNHFNKRSASPYGIAPHCKKKDQIINNVHYLKQNHNKCANKRRRKNRAETSDLLACNRSSLRGFLTYYSSRPFHFQDLFGYVFSEKNARICFVKLQEEVGI